jgi:hypothetical protein
VERGSGKKIAMPASAAEKLIITKADTASDASAVARPAKAPR